jgi:hypothetical protein
VEIEATEEEGLGKKQHNKAETGFLAKDGAEHSETA